MAVGKNKRISKGKKGGKKKTCARWLAGRSPAAACRCAAAAAQRGSLRAPGLTPRPAARRVDPFTRKDWYDVKAPSMFTNRSVGKTLVTRTQGTKVRPHARAWGARRAAARRGRAERAVRLQIASDALKGRVFDVSLADLQQARRRRPACPAPPVAGCGPADAARRLQNEADAYRKMLLRVEEVQGKFCLTNFWVRPPRRARPVSLRRDCPGGTAGWTCGRAPPGRGLSAAPRCRAWTSRQISCARSCASGRR